MSKVISPNLSDFTPAQVAWARVPKKLLYNHYRQRKFLRPDDVCDEIDRQRTNNLRLELSKRSFYPYYPTRPWIDPENERQLSVFENQKASLHELIEELSAVDIFGLWEIARHFVKFPIDPAHLQAGQQQHQAAIEPLVRAFYAKVVRCEADDIISGKV